MLELLVVGAGFAGLGMLQRSRALGLTALVLEAGGDVGGTWYWNRYPGARCDVESLEYSYGFDEELQQQWQWSERYAAQPEILRYARHVAERFDLRRDIRFQTRVVAASFDETSSNWEVRCDDGTRWRARHLVMATGPLSSANLPDIPGRDRFAGRTYHTGHWPHEPVDFKGLRVAVIGTGSSAVQAVPVIAQQASALLVFQRTATYSVPARNQPLDAAEESEAKSDYAGFRARNAQTMGAFGARYPRNAQSALQATAQEREAMFEHRWQIGGSNFMGAFGDLITDAQANKFAADFVRSKIRAVVRDPATAERLLPAQPIGCKRLCLDTGYFETFNLPHVHLVDIAGTGIEAIEPQGVRVAGQLHEVDAIVFATGFDAITGSLLKPDIRGLGGLSLRDKWHAGPLNYLGLGVHGFPNLFMVCGPGSPSVLTNMLVSIEQHVRWITDCMVWMRDHCKSRIEADVDAEAQWVGHVNAVAAATLYPSCNSWYLGANVPGKVRVFMPLLGFPAYAQKCEAVAAQAYSGFHLA